MAQTTVKVVRDNTAQVAAAIRNLGSLMVLVGVPEAKNTRLGSPIGNAAIAYIQEHGSPSTNLPARPFLVPGVQSVQAQTLRNFRQAAQLALAGNQSESEKALMAAGLRAVNAVRATIRAGIPPPLSARTIAGREKNGRGRKGRASPSLPPAFGGWVPLIFSGILIQSITFVIRRRRNGPDVFINPT